MAEALPLQPGDPERLGDFPITGRLGVGEQGAVFVGRAASGRSVAVKLLHVRLGADDATRTRFADAFAGARRVTGFSTAEILAADVEDGRPYVVSDLVDGPSLAELVAAEGPRGPLVVERLAVGLAVALAAAHRAGAVHHDLKPANVLLAKTGPRLTDLGVITALEAVNAAPATRAENNPSFLAPEQLSGHGIGPAADVFAWATTLLFAATGEPPFGDGPPAEVMQRIVYDDPEADALPESVRDAVASALDKSPSERPTASDLLRLLLDSPLAARTPATLRAEAEALAAPGAPTPTSTGASAPSVGGPQNTPGNMGTPSIGGPQNSSGNAGAPSVGGPQNTPGSVGTPPVGGALNTPGNVGALSPTGTQNPPGIAGAPSVGGPQSTTGSLGAHTPTGTQNTPGNAGVPSPGRSQVASDSAGVFSPGGSPTSFGSAGALPPGGTATGGGAVPLGSGSPTSGMTGSPGGGLAAGGAGASALGQPEAASPASPSTSAPNGVSASASGAWTPTPGGPPAADDGPSTMLDLPRSPASSAGDDGPATRLDMNSPSGGDGGPSTVLDLRPGGTSGGPPVPSSPRPAGGWESSRATARDLPVTGPSALPGGSPAPGAFGAPSGPSASGPDSLIPGMRPVGAEDNGSETAVLSLPGLRAARPQLKKPQLKKPGNHVVGVAVSLAVGVLVGVAIISLVLWPQLRGGGGGGDHSKHDTPADGRPVTTIPDTFAGTWKGTAVNANRGESFPLQVTLQAGAKTGTAVYPKEGCTGTLALTKGTAAELQLALSVNKPCTSGDVRITRQPDGSLKYDWSKPGTPLAYRGNLTKS
ncbi:serine/threonine protein kinase [Actinomadura logoneensis]|uniref:Serine/threonine protein kinase n=1 Tax=Actinomadura logoneensis TaxID=2293572 RepID=A0A372JR07_9ACTN|nr:serine/threonine protein kinase [Actinomadura logoneensis]RFU42452.1 serine/threonine protein kinase [Actinomadura logoneensis]